MHRLSPRSRRRAGFLAAVVVVIVGTGVIHEATKGDGHSPTERHYDLPLGENNLGIAYGARPQQVLRRLGKPNERRGACWIYHAADGKVNGHATLEGAGVDGMKYCFAEDAIGGQAVSRIEWHFKPSTYHNVLYPAHWGQPEYIGCNSKHPCVPKQP